MENNWHEFLIADFDSGKLTWKKRAKKHFLSDRIHKSWNSKYAGHVAGSLEPIGYIKIRLFDKPYRAHRIIWEMANGAIPNGFEIDHIDKNKSNNSLKNLRLATHAENMRNINIKSNNTSGVCGVYIARDKKFEVEIKHNGKKIFLGRFDTIEKAASVRREAEVRYYGEFASTT